jgi:hypothetical protein
MTDQQLKPLDDSIQDRAAFCRDRIEHCEEILRQLQGYTPDEFKFTFTIKTATIAAFDIGEQESWFVMAFFLAWNDYYKKELKRIPGTVTT